MGKKNAHDLLTSATPKVDNMAIKDETINKIERVDNFFLRRVIRAIKGIIQSHLKPKKTTTSKLNQLEGLRIRKYPLKAFAS